MKTYCLDYYNQFKCKANNCKKSCCKLWNISIDKKTLSKYKKDDGKLQKDLQNKIDYKKCEVIMENGKCPFLDEDNLCKIIKEYGEGYLSKTCADHPRFRLFLQDRIEVGLGLCCEECAKIILSKEEAPKLVLLSGENTKSSKNAKSISEDQFVKDRDRLLKGIADKNMTLKVAESYLLKEFSFTKLDIGEKDINLLLKLEQLDSIWKERLLAVDKKVDITILDNQYRLVYINMLRYFLFRHLAYSFDKLDFKTRVLFSLFSVAVVRKIVASIYSKNKNVDFDLICEIAREYSAEIEYSEDNFFAVLDYLEEKCVK